MSQLVLGTVMVQCFVASPTVVAVYEVGGPPLPVPLVTVMVACVFPATAVGVAGVLGARIRSLFAASGIFVGVGVVVVVP